MWEKLRYAAGVAAFSSLGATASGAVIADFQNDFQAGTPKAGWSYLWNAHGPVGHAANYVPLVPVNRLLPSYETSEGTLPHPGPGANLAVTGTTIYPGQGSAQAVDGIERFAIVGYTIGAGGGEVWLDSYRFTVPFSPEANGIVSRIYVNDMLLIEMPLPPGLDYDSATSYGAYPVPLGNLKAGDTVYIAVGANGMDTGDALDMSFTLSLVPEPGTVGMLGVAGLGLLARRRRRV